MQNEVVFYVVRHGQALFNVMGKVQGWCDTPLSEAGLKGAESLAKGLAETEFVFAYSSDSGRAVKTLETILQPHGLMPQKTHDDRLREWCYGDLEGEYGVRLREVLTEGFGADLSMEELNDRMPEIADVIVAHDGSCRAERFDAIEERLTAFFEQVGERVFAQGGGNVLVVSHAFAIKTLVYLYARDRVNETAKIENTSVTKLSFDGKSITVGTIGDTSYMH